MKKNSPSYPEVLRLTWPIRSGIPLLLFVFAALLFTACEKEEILPSQEMVDANGLVSLRTGDCVADVPLVAGQNTEIGRVMASLDQDNDELTVTYTITEPDWCLNEVHLHVGASLDDIPQTRKGNPQIGHFDYSADFELDPCIGTWTQTVDWTGNDAVIAAHAVACRQVGEIAPDLSALDLPPTVTISVDFPGTGSGGPSYFDLNVSGGSTLDGTYDSYCVDTDRTISPGQSYTAAVLSSYDPNIAPGDDGVVDIPSNLDKVNWLLNQNFIGQAADCGGVYTYGDVQRAIWGLIENEQSTAGLGNWEPCRAQELIDAANANGAGYTPGCGDRVAIIFVPIDPDSNPIAQVIIGQVVIGETVIECTPVYECETAWGNGFDQQGSGFPGNSWATYFEINCDD